MIDAKGIEQVIPHRGNMRLVDEIIEVTDTHAVGKKYVRDDEFWCAVIFQTNRLCPVYYRLRHWRKLRVFWL